MYSCMSWLNPGGTQIWFGWSCAAQASKPYPFLSVIFEEKVPIVRGFSGNMYAHFLQFFGVCIAKHSEIFEIRPYVTFVENGTHV